MTVLRVGLAQLNPIVGDLDGNLAKLLDAYRRADAAGCDVVAFPELSITGYPPEDLLLKPGFVADNERVLGEFAAATTRCAAVIGFVDADHDLFNAAAVCIDGEVIGTYRKRLLPNYAVFDEARYFTAGAETDPFELYVIGGVRCGISICEDIWSPDGPLLDQAIGGAELSININASPYHHGKAAYRERMLSVRASDSHSALVYVNQVGGQDELVFDGSSLAFDANGELVGRGPQFVEEVVVVDVPIVEVYRQRLLDPRGRISTLGLPEVLVTDVPRADAADPMGAEPAAIEPSARPDSRAAVADAEAAASETTTRDPAVERANAIARRALAMDVAAAPPGPDRPVGVRRPIAAPLHEDAELYQAVVVGTRDYVTKNGFTDVVVGLSGGIDSTLVAAVAVDALGAEHVHGVSMPSRYSSEHSKSDAELLAENLGIDYRTISIEPAFGAYLEMLEESFEGRPPGLTQENLQSRCRGQVLMALSNEFGWMVLTTGNKSEMAVGYFTIYGDSVGGYAMLKDVLKTRVSDLCRYVNVRDGREVIPESVITKPPSAELRPDQRDDQSLPPYEVLDPILELYVEQDRTAAEIIGLGHDPETVRRITRLVDVAEYKRRQCPPGARVSRKAFGRDRRMPITNGYRG